MRSVGLRGELSTSLFLPDGTLLCSQTCKNHITNAGIKSVCDLIAGITPLSYRYIQIGTGGESYEQLVDGESGLPIYDLEGHPVMGWVMQNVSDTDTALFAAYAETGNLVQAVQNGIYQMTAVFQIPLDVPISEAGVFAGPAGTVPKMLAKQVFSNTVKMWQARRDSTKSTVTGTFIQLQIDWKIFFGRDPQYESLYDPDIDIIS